MNNYSLLIMIDNNFSVGEQYTKAYLKKTLQNIFNSFSINKVAKATTIKEYFEVKECKLSGNINGFTLLKKLYTIKTNPENYHSQV